jgi:hypothetical protein
MLPPPNEVAVSLTGEVYPMRRLFLAFPLSFALGFALYGCHVFGPPKEPPDDALAEGPRIGEFAPEIEGEDIEGSPLRLRDYRGKVVAVDFWANW